MSKAYTSVPEDDLCDILQHCAPLWPELRGRRLLITGGTGFFGIWILETLAAANRQLQLDLSATIVSRNPEAFGTRHPHLWADPAFSWIAGSPADFAFPNERHDFLLHLATATSAYLDRTDPIEMLSTKLASIRHVLEYARLAGVQRVLVTSSGAVYGPQPPEMTHIPEIYLGAPDPMLAVSAYGNGKRLVEQVCALYPTLDIVTARCFSFVGPHLPFDARFAAGNFIRDALAGDSILIGGDGSAVRSYLYSADLVAWLLTLLVKGERCTPYNVGSDAEVITSELARLVSEVGCTAKVTIMGMSEGRPANRYVPHIGRAQALGLAVWTPLREAIGKTLRWAKACAGDAPLAVTCHADPPRAR